jgi:hypothetical protein
MPGVVRLVLSAALLVLAACGGADFPSHNGYGSKKAKPWRKPIVVALDARGEAEVDDVVSYPRKQRARWFAVDLPGSGELDVDLSVTPISDRRLDLAFEVLDEGYRMLVRADREEDDAGEDEKRRTLYELPPGRYYVHVWAQGRTDEADFTMNLRYRPAVVASDSGFPGTVAFVGQLAEVPSSDDSPAAVVVKPRCKGKDCTKKPAPEPAVDRSLRARIAGITTSGTSTAIKIDRGASEGVAVGWRGEVITRDGKAIPGGRFEVSRVSQRESFATVKASSDAVTAAKYVRLRPP